MRVRCFFLTIHKEAKCAELCAFKATLEHLEEDKGAQWAYIKHDKDKEDNGQDKKPHYHVWLYLRNATTLGAVIKKFEGAHVEAAIDRQQAYNYLTHNTKKAKEGGKYQYPDTDKVHSSNFNLKVEEDKEPFDLSKLAQYIAEGVTSIYPFLMRFGNKGFKEYWKAYKECLNDYQLRGEAWIIEAVSQARDRLDQEE